LFEADLCGATALVAMDVRPPHRDILFPTHRINELALPENAFRRNRIL
jgi:hypothetical protein